MEVALQDRPDCLQLLVDKYHAYDLSFVARFVIVYNPSKLTKNSTRKGLRSHVKSCRTEDTRMGRVRIFLALGYDKLCT